MAEKTGVSIKKREASAQLPSRSLGLTRSTRWRRLEARLAFDGAAAAVAADAAAPAPDAEVPGTPASPVQSLDDAKQHPRVNETPDPQQSSGEPVAQSLPDAESLDESATAEPDVAPEAETDAQTTPTSEKPDVEVMPDAGATTDDVTAQPTAEVMPDVPETADPYADVPVLTEVVDAPVMPEPEDDGLYMGDFGLDDDSVADPDQEIEVLPVEPDDNYSQIVFVDSRAVDHENLVLGIAENVDIASDGVDSLHDVDIDNDFIVDDVRIVVIDRDTSGIEQISSVLESENGLDAIHIVSHGSDGSLLLGSDWLSDKTVADHADTISVWRGALSDDADLLIYGCDFAASESGRALAGTLAELTGADIAASENATGTAALGGDWTLEFAVGEIDTSALVAHSARWSGLLDPFVVTSLSDSGAGTLREAIRLANTNGNPESVDTITFAFDRSDVDIWSQRYVYRDDGVEGSIDDTRRIASNQLAENIANIDSDFQHAWYEIQLLRPLDSITETVFIDGTGVDAAGDVANIVIRGDNLATATGLVVAEGADGTEIRGLTINGFTGSGISVLADDVTITNSHFGTDASGFLDVGNTVHGIYVSGASAVIDSNVISGNDSRGIFIDNDGDGAIITSNMIGVTADGMSALGNGSQGILVEGNDVQIGGSSRDLGNVISGNDGDGIQIGGLGKDATISNNYIGTNVLGNGAIGNGLDGIRVTSFTNSGSILTVSDNVIAANGGYGISLSAVDNAVVQGNIVGASQFGASEGFGNDAGGIYLRESSDDNLIGGVLQEDYNSIVNNGGNGGVFIEDARSTGNTIIGNTIFGNNGHNITLGSEADKGERENDPFDADTGPNDYMNRPELTEVTLSDTTIRITVDFEGIPGETYRIEFFNHDVTEPGGPADLVRFQGHTDLVAGSDGRVQGVVGLVPNGLEAGDAITATATLITASGLGSTSEVSRPVTIVDERTQNDPPQVDQVDVVLNLNEGESLDYQVPVTDPNHSLNQLSYSLSGNDADRFDLTVDANGVATVEFADQLPDYEDAGDRGPWFVRITATDPDGAAVSQTLTINLQNVNERPEVTARTSFALVEEGTTRVTTLTATDPDDAGSRLEQPREFNWQIANGPNSHLFTVTESSVPGELTLQFNSPPDFENLNEDTFTVTVYAYDDGGLRGETTVTVRVINVNEDPWFTSSNRATITEGTTGAIGLSARDPETLSRDINYVIDGGVHADLFEVVRNANGDSVLQLKQDAQWVPGDSNRLTVDVLAVDGDLATTRQSMVIDIRNINDSPEIERNKLNPNRDVTQVTTSSSGGPVLDSIRATDADGDTLTYSIIGGADSDRFSIDPNTGRLVFTSVPDAANPADADGDNSYQVIVSVSDGNGGSDTMMYEVQPEFRPSDNGPGTDTPDTETPGDTPPVDVEGDGFDGSGPFKPDEDLETDLDKGDAETEDDTAAEEPDLSTETAEDAPAIEPLTSLPNAGVNDTAELPVNEMLHVVRQDIREITSAVSDRITLGNDQDPLVLDLHGEVSDYMFVGELIPLEIDDGGVRIDRVAAVESIEQVSESLDSLIGNMVDQMQEEAAAMLGSPVVAGVVVGATVSLSVGYVSWLLRVGYLLTGVLAFLPSLRLLDPIAVLSTADNDSKRDDLAQMSDADREVRSIFSQARLDFEPEEHVD